jgi:hypothetical protein
MRLSAVDTGVGSSTHVPKYALNVTTGGKA